MAGGDVRRRRRRRPRSQLAASAACALACILSITLGGGGGGQGGAGVEAFVQPPLPTPVGRAGGRCASLQQSRLDMSAVGDVASAAAGAAIKPGGGVGKKGGTAGGGPGGGGKAVAAAAAAGAAVKPRQSTQPRKGGGGGGGGKRGPGTKGQGQGLSSYARRPQHPPHKYSERKGLVVQAYQEAQREVRAGRVEKAEELFRRCLTMDRKDARSWLQLAQLANRRGRQEEARSYFAQVRIYDGGCVLMNGCLGGLLDY